MKNSNDTIENRTRDLPTCSAVPQPTAPPRAPTRTDDYQKLHVVFRHATQVTSPLKTLDHPNRTFFT
jgi:hypothetical protein